MTYAKWRWAGASALVFSMLGVAGASHAQGLVPSAGDETEEPACRTDVSGPISEDDHGLNCKGETPCLVVQTDQAFRILPRTRSPLLREPDEESEVRVSSVTGFAPLYVYGIRDLDLSDAVSPEGFYHVGRTDLGPDGWMRARDVLEWRQALVLEFEHPGQGEDRRLPTLFFQSQKDLREVVNSNDRKGDVKQIRSRIAGGESTAGVIAREPASYADITNDLYVYPILEWSQDEATDERARYLRVLTSVPGERSAPEESPVKEGKIIDAGPTAKTLDQMDVDVVFVLDTTGSMQPYIDSVKEALANSAEIFDEEFAGARQVRFGLIGYRDDSERSPELGFTTKNFTGDELVDLDELVDVLDNGGERIVADPSPDEWEEEVFSGVKAAIDEVPWSRRGSFRIVALIGDASSHEPDSEKSVTGLDAEALRQYATDNDVYMIGSYIENIRAEEDWPAAQKQFSVLTTNPGGTTPNSGNVSAATPFMIEAVLSTFAMNSRQAAEEALAEQSAAQDGETTMPEAEPGAKFEDEDDELTAEQEGQVAEIAEKWSEGLKLGIVDYLGSGQTPPADFTGWVLDNDLSNPNRRAVGVRVLISRAELDTIIRRLSFLLDSLNESEVSEIAFFEALQDMSVRAGLDIEIEESQSFRSSDLLPKWIGAMPYKSEVLDLSPRMFEEMTTQDRADFKRRNQAKLEAYNAIMAKSDGWKALDREADELEHVYPLDLNALP